MRSIRLRFALAIAAACTAVATPAHAQRIADLAPGLPSHAQQAPADPAPAAATLSASRDLAPAPRPRSVQVADAEVRPMSVGGHTVVGAAAGAATGGLAFLAIYALSSDCHATESMCGIAIPFMVGGGAVTGGLVGLVVGLIRNR